MPPCAAEVLAGPHKPRARIEIPRVALGENDRIGKFAELAHFLEAAGGPCPAAVLPTAFGDRVAVQSVAAEYADGRIRNRHRVAESRRGDYQ